MAETDVIVDLRERLWALVPSIDRTMSHGRALITVRDEAGMLQWMEVDTFTEAELLALMEYYRRTK